MNFFCCVSTGCWSTAREGDFDIQRYGTADWSPNVWQKSSLWLEEFFKDIHTNIWKSCNFITSVCDQPTEMMLCRHWSLCLYSVCELAVNRFINSLFWSICEIYIIRLVFFWSFVRKVSSHLFWIFFRMLVVILIILLISLWHILLFSSFSWARTW